MIAVSVESIGPFDLALSLRAARSFAPEGPDVSGDSADVFRVGVRLTDSPAILEIRQTSVEPAVMEAKVVAYEPGSGNAVEPDEDGLRAMAERLVSARLDVRPFYRSVAAHPILGPLATTLYGLKAFRPSTLFEMLVIAVVEQQISLLAAYHIRERLVRRFGQPLEDMVVFPTPRALAEASLDDLMSCGLSRRKSEYVGGLAGLIEAGAVDPESWGLLADDKVREQVTAIRGFGRWSAEYLLVRGLGRVDVAPADDLGIQTLLGRILADGRRLAADEVTKALEPFAPFRGLAVFYILAGSRLALL
jgi:DNA-3-methyladenine glycosylase II